MSKKSLMALVVAAMMPMHLPAASHLDNNTDGDIIVFWRAAGCGKIKTDRLDGCESGSISETFVCKKKKVGAGQSESYSFNKGASRKRLKAYYCDSGKLVDSSDRTGNKGGKKRCQAFMGTDAEDQDKFKVRCGEEDAAASEAATPDPAQTSAD